MSSFAPQQNHHGAGVSGFFLFDGASCDADYAYKIKHRESGKIVQMPAEMKIPINQIYDGGPWSICDNGNYRLAKLVGPQK